MIDDVHQANGISAFLCHRLVSKKVDMVQSSVRTGLFHISSSNLRQIWIHSSGNGFNIGSSLSNFL